MAKSGPPTPPKSNANKSAFTPQVSEMGYFRIAACSPALNLGAPLQNANQISRLAQDAKKNGAFLALFPELSLTGYSCEDTFGSNWLLGKVRLAVKTLLQETKTLDLPLVFGMPYLSPWGSLYNCALVTLRGRVLGAVPKIYIPNHQEYYEKRWFHSGHGIHEKIEDPDLGSFVLSARQIFQLGAVRFGIEICEDLWAPLPPSTLLATHGAEVILNLSASNEWVGKAAYRRELVKQQSARLVCTYVYASSGPLESSKDTVFSGALLIAENGQMLAEGKRFQLEDQIAYADTDLEKIKLDRIRNGTFGEFFHQNDELKGKTKQINWVCEDYSYRLENLERKYSKYPFIPASVEEKGTRLEEIFQIQATGLARRLISLKSGSQVESVVLGLSGGVDSCLALLVCVEALNKLRTRDGQNLAHRVLAVSMPGPGTTARTKEQARQLATSLGVGFKEISIDAIVRQHLSDLQHDSEKQDLVFQNAQARARTLILMDLANQTQSIVVGTGDLSEIALGWCTYNADHMSHYAVNSGVPKTLIQELIRWYRDHRSCPEALQKTLDQILTTPISPELLRPGKNEKIIHETEKELGPYVLHDFFLFHFLRNGFSPEKILFLARQTFEEYRPEEIAHWAKIFFKRFFSQQFKRSCIPCGPKVGSVALSPRADWRMPDEIQMDEIQMDEIQPDEL